MTNPINSNPLFKQGSLYSDFRGTDALDEENQALFDAYKEKLQQINTQLDEASMTSWELWEKNIKEFYKSIIHNAFSKAEIRPPKNMEIYFSGSLAKQQATLYSDLDSFVLYETAEDEALATPVFTGVNFLLHRLFNETQQLCVDPLGINPEKLKGTVEGIFSQLKQGDFFANNEVIITAIMMSKPVLGRHELGEQLREKIKADPELSQFCSAQYYYEQVSSFASPSQHQQGNIKSHLMRPIDFLLMGLREEFNLYCEDGSHLSAMHTLDFLDENHCINPDQIFLIENTYIKAMALRFEQHRLEKKESDEVNHEKRDSMRESIKKLREIAEERKALLNHPSQHAMPPDLKRPLKAILAPVLATILESAAGAAAGFALVFFGVFTPFGAGMLGILALAGIGALAGFLIGGLSHLILHFCGKNNDPLYSKLDQDNNNVLPINESSEKLARLGRPSQQPDKSGCETSISRPVVKSPSFERDISRCDEIQSNYYKP
ncbi:hypothetical protein [Legionella fairfieldensis]|uniref:hypothetical protein n=1 Tax=Legionella fairfieldensis TaxID=45064 RepID=UPI001041092A|nr:hypothetical protein [Legionella fairfieldensis]